MAEDVITRPSRRRTRVPVPCDPVDHPVANAWRSLASGIQLDRVDLLRQKNKTQVYRLGLRNGGTSVVAKRGRTERLLVERAIYESVLPRLDLPALRYYGFVGDEDEEFAWLFIEDAGDARYSHSLREHETLTGRWLGALHGRAAGLDLASSLPDRGPAHYLGHLRSACATILDNLDHPALRADDKGMLSRLVAICELMESGWGGVEAICDGLPRTLVHGDLNPKNLRLKSDGAGTTIAAFDWEWSGWAVPAIDIYLLTERTTRRALLSYESAMSEYADALDGDQIRSLSLVGKGFRLLASADWASRDLLHPWPEHGVGRLHALEQPLREWGEGLTATA